MVAGANAAEPREETRFGSNPGNLRMFSYVPADLAPGAPLIVVLHGCKQKAVTFARDAGWLALADRSRLALVLPEQKGLPSYLHDVYVSPGVTVKGKGRGGRNVEFLLSLAVTLEGLPGVFALAGDTDGVDGAEEIAGAIVTPDTLQRAAELGINAKESLEDNDAHSYFETLGDQVITGPTLTNVNDFRAILVIEQHERPA